LRHEFIKRAAFDLYAFDFAETFESGGGDIGTFDNEVLFNIARKTRPNGEDEILRLNFEVWLNARSTERA
jgi:hypothetical protein